MNLTVSNHLFRLLEKRLRPDFHCKPFQFALTEAFIVSENELD